MPHAGGDRDIVSLYMLKLSLAMDANVIYVSDITTAIGLPVRLSSVC